VVEGVGLQADKPRKDAAKGYTGSLILM